MFGSPLLSRLQSSLGLLRQYTGTCKSAVALALTAAAFASPAAQAQTAFSFKGSTQVGTPAAPQAISVPITRAGSIASVKVLAQGSTGYDYQDAGDGTCSVGVSYPIGQSCTVDVVFKPIFPGSRPGAVVLIGQDGSPLGTTFLSGSALGALGAFIPGTINTVAGNENWIYGGDGTPATFSSIFLPFGIALNAAGDLFITDTSNDRIRKVLASDGNIYTVAGNGIISATGDGGPATQATVNNPSSIALDGAGNVFFTDSGNNAIRRVDAFTGIITTVVGTLGKHGYSGDGGPATSSLLNTPNGIAFDLAGNLYIADTGNNAIRRLDAVTGVITTFAGTGQPGYSGEGGNATAAALNAPWSVTPAPNGTLYIADQGNHCVRAVDTSNIIRTVIGMHQRGFQGDGGQATQALLNAPANVAIDVIGNIYVADSGNNVIRKVISKTGIISTIAGNTSESITGDDGPATQAGLYGPYTMALDGFGNLYMADVFHNRIRRVSTSSATLIYQPIRVNRVSPVQTQTFENDGNVPLTPATITAVSNSVVDPATTTCSAATPLAPLDTCSIGAKIGRAHV